MITKTKSIFDTGQYTIPFDCLQPGYRHLKLRSLFDEPLDGASLFVHIAISDPDLSSSQPSTPTSNLSTYNSKASGKKGQQKRLKRQRSRKEFLLTPLYNLNKPEIDNVFESSTEQLDLATSLSRSFQSSLVNFKETCGGPRLGTILQCIRALAKRAATLQSTSCDKNSIKIKHANGSLKRFERSSKRSASNTNTGTDIDPAKNPVSSEFKTTANFPRFTRSNKRVSMVIEGSCNEEWKRVGVSLDVLMDECLTVTNQALNCCNTLSSLHEKASQMFKV